MMELIDKQEAIDALNAQADEMSWWHERCDEQRKGILTAVRIVSDIKPKRGHWMIEPIEEPEYCKCSECGYTNLIVEVFSLDGYNYCPNCGAKMERNEDGTDL